jgi:hypothetical protein
MHWALRLGELGRGKDKRCHPGKLARGKTTTYVIPGK